MTHSYDGVMVWVTTVSRRQTSDRVVDGRSVT
jgi:hypothetical protein